MSDAAPGTRSAGARGEGAAKPARHWRDNLEAVTMAIVMAVMLKYFVVEAYKIPTGSMQPTLMGNEETRVFDRILVDKLSYHLRDPERFEVVVFKYPLDRSKNFIKRLVGMPGEHLRIEHGDLWTRAGEGEPWQVLRRPEGVMRDVWKRIHPSNARFADWKILPGADGWEGDGRSVLRARGDGRARLPNDSGPITDDYHDGYPGSMGDAVAAGGTWGVEHHVGDVRLEGTARALPGCVSLSVELREGDRRYALVLPGPAAPEDARPRIEARSLAPSNGGEELGTAVADVPLRLPAGAAVRFAAENLDDRLALEVDGEEVCALPIPAAEDQRAWVEVAVEGEGCDLTRLQLFRDIYYSRVNALRHEWEIPEGHYVMLGDNTQNSSDARAWAFVRYSWPGEGSEGEIVRGNHGDGTNPRRVDLGRDGGMTYWLRDEWGELHVFPGSTARQEPLQTDPSVSLVPRELITGRAVLVFWPYAPSLGTYRLKWIR